MPGIINANASSTGFAGIRSIYQYTNPDGTDPNTVCGLAACSTLLTYCGFMQPRIQTLRTIERSHPADVLGGRFGTSPFRIKEILRHYGATVTREASSFAQIKKHVSAACPVICLIQNTGGITGLGDGAHWFVVFAYDNNGVYVTNYGERTNQAEHLKWDDFKKKWNSPLSNAADLISFSAITNISRRVPDFVPSKRSRNVAQGKRSTGTFRA